MPLRMVPLLQLLIMRFLWLVGIQLAFLLHSFFSVTVLFINEQLYLLTVYVSSQLANGSLQYQGMHNVMTSLPHTTHTTHHTPHTLQESQGPCVESLGDLCTLVSRGEGTAYLSLSHNLHMQVLCFMFSALFMLRVLYWIRATISRWDSRMET